MSTLDTGSSDRERGSTTTSGSLDPNRMISETEAAKLRCISRDTLRRQVEAGEIRRYRVGAKRIAYRYSEIIDAPQAD